MVRPKIEKWGLFEQKGQMKIQFWFSLYTNYVCPALCACVCVPLYIYPSIDYEMVDGGENSALQCKTDLYVGCG